MYKVSKLIASTNSSFTLSNDLNSIAVYFIENFDIDSLLKQLRTEDMHEGRSLSLHFEHLRGNDQLPVIDVYMNIDKDHLPNDDNYVGSMGLYGLSESSEGSNGLDGEGQHRTFDVSTVFNKVRKQSNWSQKQFNLSLRSSQFPFGNSTLSIGRITLYYYEN